MSLLDGDNNPAEDPQNPPADPSAGDQNPPSDPPPADPSGDVAAWLYADGIAGEGDKPEWLQDKYGSVEAQAKAYPELAKKFGGFTGAPDGDYEVSLPEGLEGEFDTESPLFKNFAEAARAANMSQDAFTGLLHVYAQNEYDMQVADKEAEMTALGDNAQTRVKNIGDWGRANLTAEEFEGLREITTSAAGVAAVEAIIAKTKNAAIPDGQPNLSQDTPESLRAAVADPKYKTSRDYRKGVDKRYQDYYGE